MRNHSRGRAPKLNDDISREIVELYDSGRTATDIALRVGCSVWSIYKCLRRAGVSRRNSSSALNPESVRQLYESGKTLAEVARELHCTPSMVYSLMRRSRIPRRGRGRPAGRVTNPDRDRAMIGMREGGATLQEIGDVFSLTRERVRQILNETRNPATSTQPHEPHRKRMRRGKVHPTRDSIEYLVRNEGLTPAQIARRLNRNVNVVREWLHADDAESPGASPGGAKQ